jgi:hypothetical protein
MRVRSAAHFISAHELAGGGRSDASRAPTNTGRTGAPMCRVLAAMVWSRLARVFSPRQRETEGRPAARAALHPDVAAMPFHDVPGDS